MNLTQIGIVTATTVSILVGPGGMAMPEQNAREWVKSLLAFPYARPQPPGGPTRMLLRQDYESLQKNRSVIGTPMRIGSKSFRSGLGTHSWSCIRITSPVPLEALSGWVGVDANERTSGGAGSVVFVVASGEAELFRSAVMRGGEEARKLDVSLSGVRSVDLVVEDGGDGPACDHADWADLRLRLGDGKELSIADLPEGVAELSGRYPFSFSVGGKHCDDALGACAEARAIKALPGGRTLTTVTWAHPSNGLRLTLEATSYSDFAALDWVIWMENTGTSDTPLIENLLPLDISLDAPGDGPRPYRLHRTAGGTPTPGQFEAAVVEVGGAAFADIGARSGRSSTHDFPFFKVDIRGGALVGAIGWSGNWAARVEAPDRRRLHLSAGQAGTRFVLHPGERIRTPRVLLLRWHGDSLEANGQFRQLIYKHYAARRDGKPPLPILFSNTCFTRGGGWLNECNAENQISLIQAYSPLGLEAVITDAGWFEGGWPQGAGNWTPRKDAYPQGMAPVAAAAAKRKMLYGLWFEPERVVANTALHREHPDWCLSSGSGRQGTYLANFGLKAVRDHFFGIVKGFMDLPGFGVYRQDFNMDPLPYWRHNDAADRQGVTEMKYIQGLYEFWDSLAAAWPAGIREECASGGHRMDLETVKRFHLHQKTDYWFDNEVDQASIWSLSAYLPNSVFVAPINRLDDYTFQSVLPTSLCIGWIADAPEFPRARAAKMLARYLALRHYLVGSYYPLTGYSRHGRDWMAMQFDRPDLGEGMVCVYRRADSPYRGLEVALHGLEPGVTYEFRSESSGKVTRARGSALLKQMVIALPASRMSDILVYRKAAR